MDADGNFALQIAAKPLQVATWISLLLTIHQRPIYCCYRPDVRRPIWRTVWAQCISLQTTDRQTGGQHLIPWARPFYVRLKTGLNLVCRFGGVCSGWYVSVRDSSRLPPARSAWAHSQVQWSSTEHAHLITVPDRRRTTASEAEHDILASSRRRLGQTLCYWSVAVFFLFPYLPFPVATLPPTVNARTQHTKWTKMKWYRTVSSFAVCATLRRCISTDAALLPLLSPMLYLATLLVIKNVGWAGICNFLTDNSKFPTEEIMSAQKFNFVLTPPLPHQMGFSQNLAFLDNQFLTKRRLCQFFLGGDWFSCPYGHNASGYINIVAAGGIAKELVDERRAALGGDGVQQSGAAAVYLTYLLSNKNITLDEIYSNVMEMLFAGTDTVCSNTLTKFFGRF